MPDPVTAGEPPKPTADEALGGVQTRKEKRKALKKLKRKQIRKEAAIKEREEEEARSNDPADLERIRLREQEEAETAERERREFEERERLWLEAAEKRKAEEEERRLQKLLEESERRKGEPANELEGDGEWDYVEDGPAEIVWHGNEIIVKKKRVKVAKRSADRKPDDEDADRPTSNPLPPQSVAFASYNSEQHVIAEELLQGVSQQVPNFGTEQDKAHCPFHLKTGACRFGTRCSRVHFYPDKSCTLLIKNMYNGPGLAWEQDEGLEGYSNGGLKFWPLVEDGDKFCFTSYTDEEVEHCYEEFYEDVHTEFLKFGELVNFKVCKNGSYHLRGNAYVHYKSLESSVLAYNTMNGRYFAGKQITCEFVGVMRWKVAICGEYMKSRLRTCSHGTACNFIHCFRNPGGDYEWADWDNPPPRYWIRKMAVLFGHPDESSHGKKMEQDDLESPRDSSRRTPINGRYHSRRSRDEIKVHDSGSAREDSYRKRDRRSGHPVRREQSRARKERSYPKKTKQSEENHKSEVCNYDIKNSLRAHDSGEDTSKKKDREYLAKHKKVEERNNHEAHQSHENNIRTREESSSRQKGEDFSDKQERSERNHRSKSSKRHREEHRFYDQLSNYTGDRRNRSSSRSSEEYFRHSVDAHDRYDGRYCSNDSDSGRDRCCPSDGDSGRHFSSQNRSHHNKQSAERRMDQFRLRDHTRHATHDNGKHGKKGKMIKRETNGDGSTSDEYPGRWETAQNDSVREETDGHVVEGKSRSHREASKSYEKLKRYREKRKHEVHSSDSDEMYDRRACNKYSRKQASTGCSASSEENSTKTP